MSPLPPLLLLCCPPATAPPRYLLICHVVAAQRFYFASIRYFYIFDIIFALPLPCHALHMRECYAPQTAATRVTQAGVVADPTTPVAGYYSTNSGNKLRPFTTSDVRPTRRTRVMTPAKCFSAQQMQKMPLIFKRYFLFLMRFCVSAGGACWCRKHALPAPSYYRRLAALRHALKQREGASLISPGAQQRVRRVTLIARRAFFFTSKEHSTMRARRSAVTVHSGDPEDGAAQRDDHRRHI